MAALLKKYKYLPAAGVLFLYLAASFQNLFLEGLHLLAHALEHEHHTAHHHFHGHSHTSAEHQHGLLATASALLNRLVETPAPSKDSSTTTVKKKLTHHIAAGLSWPSATSCITPRPGGHHASAATFYPAVPTPPPRPA